jgi:hypothetical protein
VHDLEVVSIGEGSALATVTWKNLRRDGKVARNLRQSYDVVRFAESWRMSPKYCTGSLAVRSTPNKAYDTAPARGPLCAASVATVLWGDERLVFWSCSKVISPHNVISPHKQGSFDFSRTGVAFVRNLPD